MALVVIGGHTRSVGKTSVVAGLISALREYHWTAMKVTQHGHGICSANGEPCHCATDDHSFAISEEKDLSDQSDTSRFLVAGAMRVWWARTQQGRLAEAMPLIRKKLEGAENVIIESNSVMKFLRPDVYMTVLDPATTDFKASAQQFLDLADAVILHEATVEQPAWESVSLKPVLGRPIFRIHPPPYVTPEIVEFVRSKLSALSSPRTSR
jgi:hypothetical protein